MQFNGSDIVVQFYSVANGYFQTFDYINLVGEESFCGLTIDVEYYADGSYEETWYEYGWETLDATQYPDGSVEWIEIDPDDGTVCSGYASPYDTFMENCDDGWSANFYIGETDSSYNYIDGYGNVEYISADGTSGYQTNYGYSFSWWVELCDPTTAATCTPNVDYFYPSWCADGSDFCLEGSILVESGLYVPQNQNTWSVISYNYVD
jgi:hypothetical protein